MKGEHPPSINILTYWEWQRLSQEYISGCTSLLHCFIFSARSKHSSDSILISCYGKHKTNASRWTPSKVGGCNHIKWSTYMQLQTTIHTNWNEMVWFNSSPFKLQTKVTHRNMIRINFWRGFFNKWCWGRILCFDSFLAIEFSICAKEKEKEKDHDIQLIYGTM